MTYLVLDVETTTYNKGNPFDENNILCYVGINGDTFSIEFDSTPYMHNLLSIKHAIDSKQLIIGFNIKFDLHWLKRYGIDFSTKRIWDCQLVHFILSGQQDTFPSLNNVANYYGIENKLDIVAEYWKNGIQTTDIPKDILEDYLKQDIKITEQIYLKQVEQIKNNKLLTRLISLHNQDLLVLQEMEYNGLLYNSNRSEELAYELDERIKKIDEQLYQFHTCDGFNFNSNDHLSCLLYGGDIVLRRREVCGIYKTGDRKGQPKERWVEYTVTFPQLVKPLKGSELQKEGYYSTDESTLKSLRANKKAKELITALLERANLEKRVSTYYRGLIKLQETLNWKKGYIYGQLNQCIARTGRLSSSRPNLQNFDGEVKELFYSRFS